MKTIEVGIDWSKEFVDLCAMVGRQVLLEERIEVNAAGFRRLEVLMSSLKKRAQTIRISIESDRHIVAGFLMRKGYSVYAINPLALSRFKETFSFSGRKDDRFDAYCLALFLQQNGERLRPANRSGLECEQLSYHLATLDQISEDRRRQINRLRALLECYFPAFSGFFGDFTDSALELLKTIRTPAVIRNLSLEEFLDQVKHIRHLSGKRKLHFYETMQQDMLSEDVPLSSVHAFDAELLIEQILLCSRQIKRLEAEIQRIYTEHPLFETLNSIPGCGLNLGPRLLAELGDNESKFDSFQAFQAYAGTSPVMIQSGKQRPAVVMRRSCRKQLRHALYWLAFCSMNFEPWARGYYDAARGRGLSHSGALRGLSNKWAKIVFSMWKSGTAYDRAKFMEKRAA